MKIVCTALDDSYLLHGLVFLDSLYRHTASTVSVYILENNLSVASREVIRGLADQHGRSVGFKTVDFQSESLPTDKHASQANYFRLRLAAVFRDKAEYALYIDADTLVTGCLDELFEMKLDTEVLAATPNPESFLHVSRLNISADLEYFNSGVLLVCLSRFHEYEDRFRAILRERARDLLYWDQDVLNIALAGKWKRLSPVWNLTHKIALMDPKPAWAHHMVDGARIIHFTGHPKPLQGGQPQHPFFECVRSEARRLAERYSVPFPATGEGRNVRHRLYRHYVGFLETCGRGIPFLGRLGDYLSAAHRRRVQEVEKAARRQEVLRREKTLAQRYFPARRVAGGLFQGLQYADVSLCGALLPKLMGTYESEIASNLLDFTRKHSYPIVYNIGCAEGYYACGLARGYSASEIRAYDTDPVAREQCRRLARLNGLGNVKVKGEFVLDELRDSAESRGLILCDCEGYESTLFSPEDPDFKRVEGCDLIIECHDFIRPGTTAALIHALRATHDVRIIPAVSRHVKACEALAEGGYEHSDLLVLCDERRPEPMNWLVCAARCAC